MNEKNIPNTFTGPVDVPMPIETTSPLLRPLHIEKPENLEHQPAPEAFLDAEIEPGDVDAFLNHNAHLITFSEITWRWAHNAITHVKTTIDGCYLGKDPITGKFKTSRSENFIVEAVTSPHIGDEYAQELARGARKKIDMERIRSMARDIGNQAILDDYDPVAFAAEAGEYKWSTMEKANVFTADTDKHEVDAEELAHNLLAGYTLAFAAQQLVIDRITDFLQNDANVEPFISRLQEILELRKEGINEFPGFLEVLNTLVTQQEIEQQSSSLEQAIIRTKLFTEDIEVFTRRVLTEPAPVVSGKAPKDFIPILEGAKMSYEAVVGSGEISEEAFVRALCTRLGSIKNGKTWWEAYEADTTARNLANWRHLLRSIRRYEHKGRVPDALKASRQQASGVRKRSNTARSRKPSTVLSNNEIKDLVTPLEEMFFTSDIAVMRGKGGGNEYTVERIADLEELMGHTIVTSFLRQTGSPSRVQEVLQACLKHVHIYPADPKATQLIKQRFTIDDPEVPSRPYRMRRFKPNAQIVTLGDPITRRIRILYGIVPSKVGSLITLQTIALREKDTY